MGLESLELVTLEALTVPEQVPVELPGAPELFVTMQAVIVKVAPPGPDTSAATLVESTALKQDWFWALNIGHCVQDGMNGKGQEQNRNCAFLFQK